MYGYSGATTVFNKEELGKNVKRLYEDLLEDIKKETVGEGQLKVNLHNVEEKGEDAHEYRLSESPKKQEQPEEGEMEPM
jgi:hypothetical protein